ncbi:hypothetical protein BDA99DRAFT_494891 [Phascolomyces articulosus]|uniref:NmrA-like domain-containing protein n=1 Tax=Phascolomyces articulosus TaxID=60185 RepID=A0AAD5KPW0_9FUNG|nr:hypothetical protein BDA99DRAFT_494891 [Phascolomyces articulosus]
MTSERIYIIGGTGNVGSAAVNELLKHKIPVTLYARSQAKVQALFNNQDLLTVIQGDYADLKPFEDSIAGHTRLFLLVSDLQNLVKIKTSIAEKAYAAGVKQIVHISSSSVSAPWRTNFIGTVHRNSEEGILAIPNRAAYVALRPSRFMSNQNVFEAHGIKYANIISDTVGPDHPQEFISPNDIGLAAANILRDAVEKHGDAVYELIGDVLRPKDRAALLTKVLGREINYVKITAEEKYKILTEKAGLPHRMAYDLTGFVEADPHVTPGLSIILGRQPETLEQYTEAKSALL